MLLQSEIKALARQIAEELGEINEKVLNVEAVGKMLGVTPKAVYTMCQRGQIPYHKHYGKLYFSSTEIKKCLLKKAENR